MTHHELPPALRNLRDELRDAAARDIEIDRRVQQRIRRGRWRRWLIVAVAALVSAGGVAVAQRVFDREGRDTPPDRIQKRVGAAADPGVVTASATPDPRFGPPWALRVFTNPAGLECVAVGRLRNGALGRYDAMRTFHKLPADVAGACEPVARSGLLVTIQLRASPDPRTIVYGLAREYGPVRVTIAGKARTLRPGPFGTFIDVRAGLLDRRGATASTTVAGRRVIRRLG
ncbi:MAG: hypothetical protein QOH83_1894 [Solirubrobacteraceae bacterium]|nr:hypothetical protein [Solirubrobacteraceae bacterium]